MPTARSGGGYGGLGGLWIGGEGKDDTTGGGFLRFERSSECNHTASSYDPGVCQEFHSSSAGYGDCVHLQALQHVRGIAYQS